MPQTQDTESKWRFDFAMPAHLQELVRRVGQPDLTGARSGWLLERGNKWFSKPDFVLFETDEQLEATFYTCAQKGHGPRPHMWGVFVVQGPSIPQPTIVGVPQKEDGFQQRTRSGHPQYWATWHGKEEGYRRDLDFKPWIVRRRSGATPPRRKKPRVSEPPGPILPASINRGGLMISASRLNGNTTNNVSDTNIDNVSINDVDTNDVIADVASSDDANNNDGNTINAGSNDVNTDEANNSNGNTVDISTNDTSGSDRNANTFDINDASGSSETAQDAVPVLIGPRETTVRFLSNSFELLRARPWDACNSSRLLFAHALAAKIVRPRDNAATLWVRMAGFKDEFLAKDDEKDFAKLRSRVEGTAVKPESGEELCVDVDVFATE
jgi:hypothetical protein